MVLKAYVQHACYQYNWLIPHPFSFQLSSKLSPSGQFPLTKMPAPLQGQTALQQELNLWQQV